MKRLAIGTSALCVLTSLSLGAQPRTPISYTARTLDSGDVRIGVGAPPALVAVFATWCRACREEFATLDSLKVALAGRGIRVIAVSVDEEDKTAVVRRYVGARRTRVLAAHDGSGTVSKTFGTVGVPETYLVDTHGVVVWRGSGAINARDPALRSAIARLP